MKPTTPIDDLDSAVEDRQSAWGIYCERLQEYGDEDRVEVKNARACYDSATHEYERCLVTVRALV